MMLRLHNVKCCVARRSIALPSIAFVIYHLLRAYSIHKGVCEKLYGSNIIALHKRLPSSLLLEESDAAVW